MEFMYWNLRLIARLDPNHEVTAAYDILLKMLTWYAVLSVCPNDSADMLA